MTRGFRIRLLSASCMLVGEVIPEDSGMRQTHVNVGCSSQHDTDL